MSELNLSSLIFFSFENCFCDSRLLGYRFEHQGSDSWRILKHFGNIPEGKDFQVEKNLVNSTFVFKDFKSF
jgi:hypothetical protein